MSIVFGSAEAIAILEKDRELKRRELLEDEEEPKGDANELADRLESIDFQIEMLESDIAGLEDAAARIREKLATMARAEKRKSSVDVRRWNEWAKGTVSS